MSLAFHLRFRYENSLGPVMSSYLLKKFNKFSNFHYIADICIAI